MKIIICDIDNTLMQRDGEPMQNVIGWMRQHKDDYKIVLVTGRLESDKKRTKEQLMAAGIDFYSKLYMNDRSVGERYEFKQDMGEKLNKKGKVVLAVDNSAEARDAYKKAGIKEVLDPNDLSDEVLEKLFMHGGSTEFKVEFNVGDCQGGWAVLKDGTGQVVGCHKSEADANAHRDMLVNEMTDILGDEVRTSKSPNEYAQKSYGATSFWDGVFFPSQKGVMGIDNGNPDESARFVSTYNSPPQKDGTESAGYGNRSAGTNPK